MQLPNFGDLDVNCLYTNKECGDFFCLQNSCLTSGLTPPETSSIKYAVTNVHVGNTYNLFLRGKKNIIYDYPFQTVSLQAQQKHYAKNKYEIIIFVNTIMYSQRETRSDLA